MNPEPRTLNLELARICVEASARAYEEVTFESDLAHVLMVPAAGAGPLVLAFRGSANTRDWLSDFRIQMVDTDFGGVHSGFWRSANSLLPEILRVPAVRAAVVVTGHSKGGAEALICARMLRAAGKPVRAVVTFGGPRVGDGAWRRSYNRETANIEPGTSHSQSLGGITERWVLEADVVTRLPVWVTGYRHVGQECFMPATGGVVRNPRLGLKAVSDFIGTVVGYRLGRLAPVVDHLVGEYQGRLGEIMQGE